MNGHKRNTQYANFPRDVSFAIIIEFGLITNVSHFTLHYYRNHVKYQHFLQSLLCRHRIKHLVK